MKAVSRVAWRIALILCVPLLTIGSLFAQQDNTPGHAIGKVSNQGNLIVLELNDDVLGKANLFDLAGHTLRFTAEGPRYRVEIEPLHWDSDYGSELEGAEATLRNFDFPFSGKLWKSFLVGASGSIRFGVFGKDVAPDPYGHRDAGVVLDRFDQLAEVASSVIEKAPAICVFLKPRLTGVRYLKELSDRVLITWDLTEPFGGLLDFTWFKTVNRFQVSLNRDGSIEMSYGELTAKDAIVGLYPVLSRTEKPVPVHFSSLSQKDGPFKAVYESFHYLVPPKPQDLSCTVIRTLGDNFDFLAYYSDFRIDNQEASPPSDGPIGGTVTGIGDTEHDHTRQVLQSRCTQGRFQLGFAEPVWVGSNEAQEGPPEGSPVGDSRGIAFYTRQLALASPNDEPSHYNYAVGHLGHEVGHRWSAYAAAKVDGKLIPLTSWPHWLPGLHTPVAFPYSLPVEASTLGGGVWQDNFNGTYTQLRDGFFVPAAGYSYLDLYLMGLMPGAEVPDFFLLKNLTRIGQDAKGHALFKAERTNVTIQDVIAAVGRRSPDVDHSQRDFNTGIVVVVEHDKTPTRELIERAEGIRQQWVNYWETTTGHRASMSTNPR
jgi:hypothetical protein